MAESLRFEVIPQQAAAAAVVGWDALHFFTFEIAANLSF
jgi:hypothetical protein